MKSPASILALVIVLFDCTSCMSAKYKLASSEVPPPIALNLSSRGSVAAEPTPIPFDATLRAVVVYHGVGSWKREAYWDEYIVTFANLGPAPLTIESAELTGLAAVGVTPGIQPWLLEDQSRTLEKKRFGLSKDFAIQVGGGIGVSLVAAGVGAVAGGTGWAAVSGAVVGGYVVLPVLAGVMVYREINGRHEIEHEFEHRRLALPLNLAPGQVAQGSLFFPITPGPRQLAFISRGIDGPPNETVIDLTPISGLHLKNPTAAAP